MLQQSVNTHGLPDLIRVRALKGFRAVADGAFQIVNPGDVVDVSRETAWELRLYNKCVMTSDEKRRTPPEELAKAKAAKREQVKGPMERQFDVLVAAIQRLAAGFEALGSVQALGGKKS
jgi:hypothetical protein